MIHASSYLFFFQAEDGIRDSSVTGVQTCALPILVRDIGGIEANVLIMPNLDAANIAYQMINVLADGLPVGPILIGAARPAHILTPSVTARGIVNMTAVAVVEAQDACKGRAGLTHTPRRFTPL